VQGVPTHRKALESARLTMKAGKRQGKNITGTIWKTVRVRRRFRAGKSEKWRRERDSNPRCRYKRHTRFPVVLLQPTRTSLRMRVRQKRLNHGGFTRAPVLAERVGFEPTIPVLARIPLFESGAFSHSATSPIRMPTGRRVGLIPLLPDSVNGLMGRWVGYCGSGSIIFWASTV
jgi:hypothetical protein